MTQQKGTPPQEAYLKQEEKTTSKRQYISILCSMKESGGWGRVLGGKRVAIMHALLMH